MPDHGAASLNFIICRKWCDNKSTCLIVRGNVGPLLTSQSIKIYQLPAWVASPDTD